MVTVFDHPSYRNDCNPSIRPQKPIRQTVRVHARTTRRTVFLFSFPLFVLPSPPLPSLASLSTFTPHTGLSPAIVVDIFINIYDNVAIFTFTTSFVWLKCFVPWFISPGNIYAYLLLCFTSVTPTCKKPCYLCISSFSFFFVLLSLSPPLPPPRLFSSRKLVNRSHFFSPKLIRSNCE